MSITSIEDLHSQENTLYFQIEHNGAAMLEVILSFGSNNDPV